MQRRRLRKGFDVEQDELVWVTCSDCSGDGVVYVDEEDAADRIDTGYTPLRTPST
jgi:hypothetical protein